MAATAQHHTASTYVDTTDDTTEPSVLKSLLAAANAHLGLQVAAFVIFAITARMWNVADQNVVTMSAVVGVTPPTDLLVTTFGPGIAGFGWLLVTGMAAHVLSRLLSRRGADSLYRAQALVLWVIGALGLVLFKDVDSGDLRYLWITGGIVISAVIGIAKVRGVDRFIRRQRHLRDVFNVLSGIAEFYSYIMLVGLVYVALSGLASDVPWMAPERLTLNDRSHIVGYVLERDASDLIVLRDHDRLVQRVSEDDVDERFYCVLDPEPDPDDYPPCGE